MDPMKSQPPRRKVSSEGGGFNSNNGGNPVRRTQKPRRQQSAMNEPIGSETPRESGTESSPQTGQVPAWGEILDSENSTQDFGSSFEETTQFPPGNSASFDDAPRERYDASPNIPNAPKKNSSASAVILSIVAVLVLFGVIVGGWAAWNNKQEDNRAEETTASASTSPSSTSTRTSDYYTPTSTYTTTETSTTVESTTTTEESVDSDYSSGSNYAEPEEQFPSPPYSPPSNYTWILNGPYGTGTSSNCIQIADSEYQSGGSDDYTECFEMSDGWYYYSLRGAG